MNTEFGFKELYQVFLRATSEIKVGDRVVNPGEVIAYFDKILIGNFDENSRIVTAHGGFDDRDLVWWESTKNVSLVFTQGIFSKTQFSLMTNGKLFEVVNEPIYVPTREIVESDENGIVKVSHNIFTDFVYTLYDELSGARIGNVTVSGTDSFTIQTPFKSVVVDYYYAYDNGATLLRVGQKVSSGYFLLEGKTRVKDDITGQTKTGIIIIPKLKLVSDLSMRLGRDATPVVGRMDAIACPVEYKGLKRVADILILKDDIDSDI